LPSEWQWWTCYRFDNAVSALGRFVENKTNQRDKDGEALYTVESLLLPPKRPVITKTVEVES
jgi:hypothetical protein